MIFKSSLNSGSSPKNCLQRHYKLEHTRKIIKGYMTIQCLLFANLTGKIYEQENTIADVGN